MKTQYIFPCFLIFLIFGFGVTAQIPDNLQPFIKLRHNYIIEAYQDPTINDEGLITDPGELISREKKVLNYHGGSGTIVTPQGLVLTNYHVFNKKTQYEFEKETNVLYKLIPASMNMFVFMLDGEDYLSPPEFMYEAMPLCGDSKRDIMVLKIGFNTNGTAIQDTKFPFVSPGNPFDLKLNEEITLLGYPGKGGETITITTGKFLGYYRDENDDKVDGFIKTEASMSPGSSGGSAISETQLIGIPTLVSSPHLAGADFGFINPVTRAAPSLVKAHTHYNQEIPDMDEAWFLSKYNTDETREKTYITGKVKSNQAGEGIVDANIVFYRRDLEQQLVDDLIIELKA
ncbi:MAG: serine protease, partial [Bacteroidales bacterium]|nr:serine protease [Bacteroidales bacterium]